MSRKTLINELGHQITILRGIGKMVVDEKLAVAGEFSGEIAPEREGILLRVIKREETKGGIDGVLALFLEVRKIRGFLMPGEDPAIVDGESAVGSLS